MTAEPATALERAIADPPPVPGIGTRSPVEGLERRTVGFVDVLAQSVSAVAPSAAATTIPLLVAVVAGGGTLWALAVAMVLSLLIAGTVNQFSRRIAATGSLYTYVSRGLGTGAGFVAGTAMLVGYGFIAMFALAGAGYYLAILLGRVWPGAVSSTGLAVAMIAAMALVVVVVIVRGIRLSTRLTLLIETVSVAIILVLVVTLLVNTGGSFEWSALSLAGSTPATFAVGAVLALTAFVGFESSSALGVEARRPFAAVPRAIVWTVIVSGSLYLVATYSQIVGFGALGLDLTASASPVNDLATAYGVEWMGLLLDVSIATSFLACAIASTTALARVLFAMGREGVLPPVLGVTHRRFRTPWVAAAVAVPVVALVPIVSIALGSGLWETMQTLIVVAAAGYITAYVLVCVAAPVFLRRIGELTTGVAVRAVAAAALLSVGLVVYLVVEFAGERWLGALVFVLLMAAGCGYYLVRKRRHPWLLDTIGVYDVPVAGDVLGGGSPG
ncbi:APC family permease [Herbiconiux moechotypicola]|uniref:APC family permease n=1 Tax=Herbiconiux moechotypicola TaxID=637393 RepID=UPI00217CEAF8|nr:APC family permease [Herbiconiux moechotypicola]MCS5729952.1 APC family permease [Herbiconiux moechotypicola]